MKSGWTGAITTDVEETIKLGEQFADFIEKGDVFGFEGYISSHSQPFCKAHSNS